MRITPEANDEGRIIQHGGQAPDEAEAAADGEGHRTKYEAHGTKITARTTAAAKEIRESVRSRSATADTHNQRVIFAPAETSPSEETFQSQVRGRKTRAQQEKVFGDNGELVDLLAEAIARKQSSVAGRPIYARH